jgi:hypothetical protein
MVTRTFKQLGQGFGSSNATITAKINGVTVFSGIVPTANQKLPGPPSGTEDVYPTLFTWTNDVDFEGTQTMEITVTGATVLLAAINANYMRSAVKIEGKIENPTPNWVPANYESSGPDTYGIIFKEEVDEFIYTDPITNVVIDGVPKPVIKNPSLLGQQYWIISPGSTFTCQLNIQAGLA